MKTQIKENYNQILQLVFESKEHTRASLSRITKLNRSTISYIIKEFIDDKIIIETDYEISTGGRKGKVLRYNYEQYNILIIDPRRTSIRYFITKLNGSIIKTYKIEYKNLEESIEEIIKSCMRKFPSIKVCAISIHGIVSKNNNIISPFYKLNSEYLFELFKKHKLKGYIENEANIYASGLLLRTDKSESTIINIHIKTGIGAGIIINNNLFTGYAGFAGEIGHMISVENGRKCSCGNKGCLEMYASEDAFKIDAHKILKRDFVIDDLYNNKKIKELMQKNVGYLAKAINDLSLMFNPEYIYICSDLYSMYSNLEEDILLKLTSRQIKTPILEIIKPEYNLLTSGFCNLILMKTYGLDQLKICI